jgi:hypothetical protein
MSISEIKLPPETAGAPIFSCASRKSSLPMGIGNGALRKSARMRQNAPFVLSRQRVTQQILANAQATRETARASTQLPSIVTSNWTMPGNMPISATWDATNTRNSNTLRKPLCQ